jgi:hypothetical protein
LLGRSCLPPRPEQPASERPTGRTAKGQGCPIHPREAIRGGREDGIAPGLSKRADESDHSFSGGNWLPLVGSHSKKKCSQSERIYFRRVPRLSRPHSLRVPKSAIPSPTVPYGCPNAHNRPIPRSGAQKRRNSPRLIRSEIKFYLLKNQKPARPDEPTRMLSKHTKNPIPIQS